MIPDIILLGPIDSGKSTLARLLAEKLKVPNYSMDALCWKYYEEIGFQRNDPDCLGDDGMIAERFHAHAMERLLASHRNCVIDLGAGHSVYRQEKLLTRVRAALDSYPNVFLVLPSPDLDESMRVLGETNLGNTWVQEFIRRRGYNPNEHFLRHPSNSLLAKQVVYTSENSPEQTRDEILNRLTCCPRRGPGEPGSSEQEEMIDALRAALAEATAGWIRSLVLMSNTTDGGSSCWSRIYDEEDSRTILGHLHGLKQDLGNSDQPVKESPGSDDDDRSQSSDAGRDSDAAAVGPSGAKIPPEDRCVFAQVTVKETRYPTADVGETRILVVDLNGDRGITISTRRHEMRLMQRLILATGLVVESVHIDSPEEGVARGKMSVRNANRIVDVPILPGEALLLANLTGTASIYIEESLLKQNASIDDLL